MKSPLKRLLAFTLALSLLLVSGCTGGGPAPSSPAMGRYVETVLTMPADFYLVLGLHRAADGSVELLGLPKSTDGTGHVYLHAYRSADGGATWTEEQHDWIDDLNRDDNIYSPESVAWDGDGTLYFYLHTYTEDGAEEHFARLDGETMVLYDGAVPYASDGSGLNSFRVADNGDFILDCWTEFLQVDPATGTVKNVYTAPTADGGGWNDGYAVNGDTLAISEAGRIVFYDLNTGKETGSLPAQLPPVDTYDGNKYRLMSHGADGSLYFADPKGLYHAVDGSDTLERLADGALTSLSTPSVTRVDLVVLDGSYLVLGWSSQEWTLYSYAYDPDVPTLPDTELTIYSLEEDPLILQAISAFQAAEPGVHVTYQTGIPEDGSVTRDDAIRALNTQLVAGKGPDVLVLDGLPMDSYIDKAVLADLSAPLDDLSGSGGLLSNITGSLKQPGGEVYAVPAQFQVPMLHGSDDAMTSIHDLTSMADWLEANKPSFRTPFLFDSSANILLTLYPVCAASLRDGQGRMDGEKLAGFLAQIKRITDLRDDPEEAESVNDFVTDFNFGPLGWTAGYNGLDLGNLVQFQGLYAAWTASDKTGDGSTDVLFGGNAFLPVTMLGVSAQSGQQDLAWRFIEHALSDAVQGKAVGKGVPVSAAAFAASTQDPKERDDGVFSTYGTTFADAEGATVPVNMQVFYPPEEYRQTMADRIKALDTPILYDETILQIITDEARDCWTGRTPLDVAVNSIMEKLKLYEAE